MLDTFIDRIRAAHDSNTPLIIQGGGSKDFYGNTHEGEVLSTRKLTGVVDYEPNELVLTARAGTPLAEIEALLAEHNQMLAFEPPHFGGPATLGGSIAAGLSGPRRPYAGAVRDFVLGVRMIDGTRRAAAFRRPGDEERRRLRCVAPDGRRTRHAGPAHSKSRSRCCLSRPRKLTLQFELDEAEAIVKMNQWAGQPLPLSATVVAGRPADRAAVRRRSRGARRAQKARRRAVARRRRLLARACATSSPPSSTGDRQPLWRPVGCRSSRHRRLDSAAAPQLIEWGGAQRWLASDAAGGHRCAQRPNGRRPRHPVPRAATSRRRFHAAAPALMTLHRRLKQRFDPAGILNPGRLYPDSDHADQSPPILPHTPEGEEADAHPAQLRALRLLPRHLPDLSAARRRAGLPARPHLPDQADARRRDADGARPCSTSIAA